MKEKISKLPKWAQDHIENLERERELAIRELNTYIDSQTPSGVFIENLVSTGEEQGPTFKKRYIQTHKVSFLYQGVELEVYLSRGIRLSWGKENHTTEEIAMIPNSFNCVVLKTKENLS